MNIKKNFSFAVVDIGGTNTRFALFDKKGKIELKEKTLTSFDNSKETCDWIIARIKKYNVNYMGLCIPGPSDYENGFIINPPNLRGTWLNFNMKEYLLKNSSLQDVVFENDANVMALSNHYENNKTSSDITQFYTISTGFGSGLVINNKVYHGNRYYAQEIAQIPVALSNFAGTHHFNNNYALELHCSGRGIGIKASHLKLASNAKKVFELAKNGNLKAIMLIQEAKETLARLIAINAGIIAPTGFYFGGSVALNNKDFILDAIDLAKKISDPVHFKNVEFNFDKNGDDSALYGLYYLLKTMF